MPSRRDFIKNIGISTALIPIMCSCEYYETNISNSGKSVEIDLTNEKDDVFKSSILANIGRGCTKALGSVNYGIPVIIVRIKDEGKADDFRCYSSLCTHANCSGKANIRVSIGKTGDNRQIVCNCHGSRFNAFEDGKVELGPAEKPLIMFQSEFDATNNHLLIKF